MCCWTPPQTGFVSACEKEAEEQAIQLAPAAANMPTETWKTFAVSSQIPSGFRLHYKYKFQAKFAKRFAKIYISFCRLSPNYHSRWKPWEKFMVIVSSQSQAIAGSLAPNLKVELKMQDRNSKGIFPINLCRLELHIVTCLVTSIWKARIIMKYKRKTGSWGENLLMC